MATSWAGGNARSDSLGPCDLILYETDDFSGDGIKVGATQATTVKFSVQKAETKHIQYGSSPSNMIVTGSACSLETSLTQASLELMEQVIMGFRLERDSTGDIIGFSFGSSVGLDDQSIARGIRLQPLIGGIPITNPIANIFFWRAAPVSESEIVFDDSTQRIVAVMWNCYLDPNRLDSAGRPTFYGGGEIAKIDSDIPDPDINSVEGTIDAGETVVLLGSNFGSTIDRNKVTLVDSSNAVSYTHLTLPTKRIV